MGVGKVAGWEMITKAHYFGGKAHPIEHEANADMLLAKVNVLLHELADKGIYDYWADPDTGTQISGAKGGSGDGGYRLPDSTTGAPSSSHKEGRGVDVYDPDNALDDAVDRKLLIKHGLYRETPKATPGWCHLTDRAPKSGCRTFGV